MKREEEGLEAGVEVPGFVAFRLDPDGEPEDAICHSQAARHGVAQLLLGAEGVVEGFFKELEEGGGKGGRKGGREGQR